MALTREKVKLSPCLLVCYLIALLHIPFSVNAQTSISSSSMSSSPQSRQTAERLLRAMWPEYKSQFVTPEGNLIDSYHKISHSEGQGTVMLFAVYLDDRQTFDRSWRWTKQNLQRKDGLFAWRWKPGGSPPITDYNNATDGDILIAWSLLLAYEKWDQQEYLDEGSKILSAIEEHLVLNFGGFTVLIPGAMHFVDADQITLNFSYYIFPAFSLFARYGDEQHWRMLYQDGLRMIAQTEKNDIPVAADWLNLSETGVFSFADKQGARTGYDAIRVPLYLAWCGHQQLLDSYRRFWKAQGGWKNAPSWVDLQNYETADYRPEPGILAIRSLSYPNDNRQLFRRYPVEDYFSTSLVMFSLLSVFAPPGHASACL